MSTQSTEAEMIDQAILDAIDAAGDALKSTGEDRITMTWCGDAFTVGVRVGAGYACDIFGHGETPSDALKEALAEKAAKTTEAAIRARIAEEVERRVRAEMEHREAA